MMAGKGSAWRKGTVHKAYRGNDEFWAASEARNKTICGKCNESWKCENAHKTGDCLGFVQK